MFEQIINFAGGLQSLLYTLAAFAGILILIRLKVPLIVAILAGGVGLGFLFGMSPRQVGGALIATVCSPTVIALVVITFVQELLAETLVAANMMSRMVDVFGKLLRRPALAMAALPAVIGLMPMPGGAVFSAPMVASAAGDVKEHPASMSAMNYWFRHIFESWWPMYPGVILAMAYCHSDFLVFAAYQIPLGIFMIVGGLLILRRIHPDLHQTGPKPPAGIWIKLLWAMTPVLLVIGVWVAVGAAMKYLLVGQCGWLIHPEVERFGPLTCGLLVSLLWVIRSGRVSGAMFMAVLRRRVIYKMVLLIVSVMVFQQVIEHVQAAPKIGAELSAMHIPTVLIAAILPFVAGMVTGLAVGFVGASFPIVVGLVAAGGDDSVIKIYCMFAYAFGHIGMMISPIHLCHVVSNQYFGTPFRPVYRRIIPAALLTISLATAYFIILSAIHK